MDYLLNELRTRYANVPPIVPHLEAIQKDLVSHLDELRPREQEQSPPGSSGTAAHRLDGRYGANVLVGNAPDRGAPVVFEPNPTFCNLLGRVDYQASRAGLVTDFSLVRGGALHRANGGYLILDAREALSNPFAWEGLKRVLRERALRIENLGDQLSAVPTTHVKPQPVPLNTKVVLIADTVTYGLLYQMDPDFPQL